MSKYKKVMSTKGIQQKEVLDAVHRVDPRVDKSLLSKIVNDVCLPTPRQFKIICDTLVCEVSDIYDSREITLGEPQASPSAVINKDTARSRARRKKIDVYNLTVELPRALAERVFSPDALRALGFLNKSDLIRQVVISYDAKLSEMKEKTADSVGARSAVKAGN